MRRLSWMVPPLLAVLIGLATNAASDRLPPWVRDYSWPVLGVFTAVAVVLEFNHRRVRDRRSDETRVRDVAAALTAAVAKQWSREMAALLSGWALPHHWSTTDRPMLPRPVHVLGSAPERSWRVVLRRLVRRVGVRDGGEPPVLDVLRRATIKGSLDFHGDLDELAALLRELPHRQVVLLGDPGAGKSVLAARITLALCAGWKPNDPVPVLLPLSSWRVDDESPRDWIKRRLRADYASADVARLVDTGQVFAVLDGLDELPPGLHAEAVLKLGAIGLPFLLTSRSREYQDAVERAGRVPATALVVELHPVDRLDAVAYLSAGLVDGDPLWASVFARLENQPDCALATALQTPLMIDLARGVDPGVLLRFTDHAEIERHLLDGLVGALYPNDGHVRFLAEHLRRQGTYEFAWWRLHRGLSAPAWTVGVGTGLVAAMLTALAMGLMVAPTVASAVDVAVLALAGACVAGAVVGSTAAASTEEGPRRINTQVRGRRKELVGRLGVGMVRGVTVGLGIGVIAELTYGLAFGTSDPVRPGLLMGLAFGAITGVAYGLVGWLELIVDSVRAASPAATLRADRTAKVLQLALFGSSFGLTTGLALGLVAGPVVGLLDGVGAGLLGVVVGLTRGPHVWTRYLVTRLVLAARGRVPWRLMPFLVRAHGLGVLRANGGAYQFRHNLLQDRLAGGLPQKAEPAEPARTRPIRSRARRVAALGAVVVLVGTGLGVGLPIAGGLQTRCELTPFDQDIRYLSSGLDYECVGVSDGGYDFAGDRSGISHLMKQENDRVAHGQAPYVRVALLMPLKPGTFSPDQIRDALQGVYIAQQQANVANKTKVQVILANVGSRQLHWRPVVDRLIQMTSEEHPLVAVVGLGTSTQDAAASTRQLAQHGIPMIAATATALHDQGLFRISPSHTEIAAALDHSWRGARPEFVFTENQPQDLYVESLRQAFARKWQLPEVLNGGSPFLPTCSSAMLYAGRTRDLVRMLEYLPQHCPDESVTIGTVIPDPSTLPESELAATGGTRLIYATPADPIGWKSNPAHAPAGFKSFHTAYTKLFDIAPDVLSLLYHDSAAAAFTALSTLPKPSTTSVTAALRHISVPGATGTFTFNTDGDPVGKPISVITWPTREPNPQPYLTR